MAGNALWRGGGAEVHILLFLVALAAGYGAYLALSPLIEGTSPSFEGDGLREPVQKTTSKESMVLYRAGHRFEIDPVAEYHTKALVLQKKFYEDRLSFSPLDIGIAWGKMTQQNNLRIFRSHMKDRAWHVNCNGCPDMDPGTFIRSIANNHIIVANGTVLEGFEQVEEGDIVEMKGYLVNVEHTTSGKYGEYLTLLTAKTSLKRDDTYSGLLGGRYTDNVYQGNCEIFFVENVTVDGNSYFGTLEEERISCRDYSNQDLGFNIPAFDNTNQEKIFYEALNDPTIYTSRVDIGTDKRLYTYIFEEGSSGFLGNIDIKGVLWINGTYSFWFKNDCRIVDLS